MDVRCPHCGHEWHVPERLRGANRDCPACGSVVTVVETEFYERTAEERRRIVEGNRQTVPVGCIIHDVRSAYNVGSILRSADGAGVSEIIMVGITPDPENPQVAKTSLGAEDSVPWKRAGSLAEAVGYFREKGYAVAAAEDAPSAADALTNMPGPPIAFVLGNEVSGLSGDDIAACDTVVKVPMLGAKASLNVSVAAGVLFYKALEQWLLRRG